MEFALHLLPHILVPPMKRKQRTSMDEAATNFIQIHPVLIIYNRYQLNSLDIYPSQCCYKLCITVV
jgi:hypothetical protein